MKRSFLAVQIAAMSLLAVSATAALAQEQPAATGGAAISSSAAQAAPQRGQMLFTSTGVRIGRIIRIDDDGAARVIFEGKLARIPADTLSLDGERLVTNLTRGQVASSAP